MVRYIKDVETISTIKDKKIYVASGLKDSFKLTNKEFTYEER